eukprot:TRINITY_DN23659_c0_g1_i1.p1 TRINITY_DN23659_c0_g1~~TRINITY_DN23659_c0_g1_i1.p1  ORF type:complete len:152 (-),score=22.88 TRINITY_DN23659_c0_g1_i1:63-518(-)
MNSRIRLILVLFVLIGLWFAWSPPGASLATEGKGPQKAEAEGGGDAKPTKPAKQEKTDCQTTYYTAADIKAHSLCEFGEGNFDLWLTIDGFVYDVSDWALYHPGGMLICTASGVDGTHFFHTTHSEMVGMQLPKFCIGKLREGEIEKLKKN